MDKGFLLHTILKIGTYSVYSDNNPFAKHSYLCRGFKRQKNEENIWTINNAGNDAAFMLCQQ